MAATQTTIPGTPGHPLRVAVVGSGPSGFYAVEALLASGLEVEIDLLERLPVPYGLVRYGVAPDHAKLKTVTSVFDAIARDERVQFFGNVAFGRDVGFDQLDAAYHAVVVATGVDGDQKLGIEGEHLSGVHSAAEFVGWYNGRPECADLTFDLSQEVAVIVGQGNVAIDVCRILAKPVDQLKATDITQRALDTLAASRLREIHLIGRRGPVQARFTPKELRELGGLEGWQTAVDAGALDLNAASREELVHPNLAHARKNLDLLRSFAMTPRTALRTIHLHFHVAPVALRGEPSLKRVVLERQTLSGPAHGQFAMATKDCFELGAGLLFRSVGYRGGALPGLPFDSQRGTLPHREGRVVDATGSVISGWYVTGWAKRGPVGVIGSNRLDSVETVASLLADLPLLRAKKPGREALRRGLDVSGHITASFCHWLSIERVERERGAEREKTAEKIVSVPEMLAAAGLQPPCGAQPAFKPDGGFRPVS